MSIKSEIDRIEQAKAAIGTELRKKGVDVPEATKLDGYPELIRSIPPGEDGGAVGAGGGGLEHIKSVTLEQEAGTISVDLEKPYTQILAVLDASADSSAGTFRAQVNGTNVVASSDLNFINKPFKTIKIDLIGNYAAVYMYSGNGLWGSTSAQTTRGTNTFTPPLKSVGVNLNGNFGVGTKMEVWGRL